MVGESRKDYLFVSIRKIRGKKRVELIGSMDKRLQYVNAIVPLIGLLMNYSTEAQGDATKSHRGIFFKEKTL